MDARKKLTLARAGGGFEETVQTAVTEARTIDDWIAKELVKCFCMVFCT